LPLSTMLANGEILFMCNRTDYKIWIQAHAFYEYGNCLYTVTKDFTGIFRWASPHPSDQFIACSSHGLFSDSTIINIKGEVIALCRNWQWTLLPPGTALTEFSQQVQSHKSIDDRSNKTGDNCHN
jgi:hypothetical protein